MMVTKHPKLWPWLAMACLTIVIPFSANAQRDVHWQLNPKGFPTDMSIFVDVEDNGAFKRDLTADAFSVSMDENAGEQGGWLLNRQNVVSGWAGAQILIVVDKSSSYTGEFSRVKKVMRSIVNHKFMDPKRDQVAIATAPAAGGFAEIKLEVGFTNNKNALISAIDKIKTLPSSDKSGARICNALAEGLRLFPDRPSDRYRIVVFLTGGADKGEGKGDCVKDSFSGGLVPFFPIVFKLDRKYDDPRNSHKIENKTHELAQKTGGRSIFRRSDNDYQRFVSLLWNRIRSQYYMRYVFPCYKPEPVIDHYSVLKVDGRDSDAIKFQATSAPAPTPVISAIYPQSATRKDVDDGNVELTVDGSGFCGPPQAVKVTIGGRPAAYKSHNPYRVVARLNSAHESGKVSVTNYFRKSGEFATKFKVVKAPKGAEASATLLYLVFGIVVLAILSIVLVGLRSRKAKPGKVKMPEAPRVSDRPTAESSSAKTVTMGSIDRIWLEKSDGQTAELGGGENVLGRDESCKVALDHSGVSGRHARIECNMSQGMVWLEDLGSTNGTFWGAPGTDENSLTRLDKKRLLSSGDVVSLGGDILIVHYEGGMPEQGEG
jgi:FHA domain/von Willebrand factor type A domain/IPT/TIG domain